MPGLFDNPFTNVMYDNSNGLLAAASAVNPRSRTIAGAIKPAFGAFGQGKLVDEQLGQVRREEAERQAQMQQEQELRDRYTQFFSEQGNDDLARAVNDRLLAPAEAYTQWMTPAPQRDIRNDPNGVARYVDSGEEVFANVGPATPPAYGDMDLEDRIRIEGAASKDYRGYDEVKVYNDIRDSYEKIREASTLTSAAGDMGLIFNFMKMLDPGSTVREGEFATAQQTTGVSGYIINLYNQSIDGSRLNAQQRREFVELAQNLYEQTAQNLNDLNAQTGSRFEGYGMNPSQFLITPEQYEPIDTSAWVDVEPGVRIRQTN